MQKEINRTYGPGEMLFDRMTPCDMMIGQIPVLKNTLVSFLVKPMFHNADHF